MITRTLVKFLKWQDKKLTSLAMRAMKWTGLSKRDIHPKHLYDDNRNIFLYDRLKPGITFLDVGSGSGSDCLQALKSQASFAYGIEINKESIALSHERLKEFPGKYEIFECNLEDAKIPLEDNTIDIISFSNVLEHLDNRKGILRELARVLKPEGIIYISIPNKDTPWKKLQRKHGIDSRDDEDHKIEYSKESLHQELAEAYLNVASPLHPIIPSLPVNGIISLSAPISPWLYKKLQNWKRNYTLKNPEHSVGWYFLATRKKI